MQIRESVPSLPHAPKRESEPVPGPDVGSFSDHEPRPAAVPWERHWRKVLGVKVLGVAVSCLLAIVFVHDAGTRNLFVLLTAGLYLPISLVLYGLQRRAPTPPNPVWFGITFSDIAVVGAAQALFPRLSVAFLGLTAIVMVSAVLLSVRWAVIVAFASWMALVGATVLGNGAQPSAFSGVMGGLLLVGMAFLIGSLAEEERTAANRSRRLAQAIGSVGSSLELASVLENLCEVARDAMKGQFSVVLMREGDRLSFGGGSHRPADFPEASSMLADLMHGPAADQSPTVGALRTMRPATLPDIEADDSMAPWRDIARRLGFRSMVSVPVQKQGSAIGVLNVYLPRPHVFTVEETEFLGALAEHAAIAIERAQLFAQEKESVSRLLELDRLKSEFVATVSHELRTPLTAIEGFALTLRNKWREFSPELRDEILQRLDDNSRSLDHLITHLLDFGRLERGEFRIELREHAVDELIRRALQNMVHELSDHPVQADLIAGVHVMTDQYAFDRILGNLLSNAAKFSEPGSAIEVRLRREGSEALVSVRDHGPGIPVNQLDRIFERFYRGTSASRGTGIGLAVVKDLVGLHAGRVEVRNASPGAEFVVHLAAVDPLADSHPYLTGASAESPRTA
jgi:signal transduction histidine kinase